MAAMLARRPGGWPEGWVSFCAEASAACDCTVGDVPGRALRHNRLLAGYLQAAMAFLNIIMPGVSRARTSGDRRVQDGWGGQSR